MTLQTGDFRYKMAGDDFQSNATFRAQMCSAECQGLKTAAQFVAFRGHSVCGIPQANFTTELAFRSSLERNGWHSAVCLRAECHKSKTPVQFVAFRGQFTLLYT
jgi:hypothetical protein